ncbi:GNAT family N-acetyltransferase [Acholeplasma sp. OttesenSCG-928-E16]|nr:GNAT family N-acetyltransferase [Acholeplasma sp. OttesenSCG-928-E16]
MAIKNRKFNNTNLYGTDYYEVRKFLIELNNPNYHFGRWDWMISHSYLEKGNLSKIGIWEDDGKIIGFATFDTTVDGNSFLLLKPGYDFLRKAMIEYAEENLSSEGHVKILIQDNDIVFQNEASKLGYIPSQHKDLDSIFSIENGNLEYKLPDGFSMTSMKDTYDIYQYGRILWKGFNHEIDGEGKYSPTSEMLETYRKEFERPNVNPYLKIAVLNKEGNFVSYCGMWYDDKSDYALVEPVATDPEYRKLGLGKCAVLEAIRRCKELGATKVYVGSSQQFYYNIGFRPSITSTMWVKKEKNK